MGSSSPQQMPPPPDSTFSAAESITTHDTLPPSKLIARDNVLLAGLLAAFAPSMADAHRLSIDDLHPDRNLLLFLHRLSPHIGTDLTGDWLHTHPALMNNYRWLRLFYGENCIALLDEHDVAAMLTNDLGILGRLLGYAQSGRFGAVYLLLRGDCNILCFFLCGVIQIGLVSGTAVLFGFTDHPIIEKSIGVKIVAGSGEAKGFEIEVKVKVEHIDLVEQLVVDPLGEFGNAVVGQTVELDRFFVGVCYDAGISSMPSRMAAA